MAYLLAVEGILATSGGVTGGQYLDSPVASQRVTRFGGFRI